MGKYNKKKDLPSSWSNVMCGWNIASVFIYLFYSSFV